ncbi:MAG: diguanylate cyclase [Eubacteriales bacterium]
MELKKLKILIISDNLSDTKYFVNTISKALPGTKVYISEGREEGLKLAKLKEPDVILIDMSITNTDSLKISSIIKKDKTLNITPILFVTDLKADRHLRNEAIKAGAEAFIFKPIDDAILITQLKSMAKIKERNILIINQKEKLKTLVEQRTCDLKNEIIERKNLEKELRKSEETLKTYIQKAPIGIFVADAKGKYIDANSMACKLMGRKREEVLKLSISDFLIPSHLDKGLKKFNELTNKGFIDTELKVMNKDNQEYWISLRAAKINDNRFIAFCSDISNRKERERRVEYLSYHDSLTGVYNRAFYEESIKKLDTEDNLPFSLIISDVNGLKLTNDTLGHAAGDKVLIETTKLLSRHLKKGDILARVGGDEFSILLPRTSSQEAQEIVGRIQKSSKSFEVDISGVPVNMSISLGFATKTKTSEAFSYISKLAEDYMYRVKILERESFHSTLLETLRLSLYERSHETEEHASRMSALSKKLGTAMGLSKDDLNDLALLSSLHDIGKISIDNSILTKPGKLNANEWLEMKKHPAIGYRIAMTSPDLKSIAEYILCHHEHWDGTGYPQGLSGEDIPLLSRVISIVDAYDAMTHNRIYRKALSKEAALAEISDNSGSQFDPEIAELFLTLI